jgi:uncharacterized protein
MPATMDEPTRRQVAARIGEYAHLVDLQELLLVFHGGEPLLAGPECIAETTEWVRRAVPATTRVDASLQTNGLLLTDDALDLFERHNISVSVSIDGPAEANDLHRLTHGGGSSSSKALDAIQRLGHHPAIYSGLIAVVDPSVSPGDLLGFFHELNPPCLDFLLPDSHHLRPPPNRDKDPDLYLRWLLRAFDIWFDIYPNLKIRTFDTLLKGIAGLPSNTDAFGFGDVSLLTIETDGSFHDLDVLKIARQGATGTGLTIWTAAVEEAARSPQIEAHRHLLSLDGLSETCQHCPEVKICGGGAVPHRFADDGFRHPTVYCREMLGLIRHAKDRYRATVLGSLSGSRSADPSFEVTGDDLAFFEDTWKGKQFIEALRERFAAEVTPGFIDALQLSRRKSPSLEPQIRDILQAGEGTKRSLAVQPSVVLWASITRQHAAGTIPTDIDGTLVQTQPEYVQTIHGWLSDGLPESPRLHRSDPFLRLPFGKQIVFEATNVLNVASGLVEKSLSIIREWDSLLLDEIGRLSPEIQFIRDPSAHPDKAVSFSDNSFPGALYVSVRRGNGWISPHDLADSIIHEHRHQKLYLLQAACPIVTVDAPLVRSPWREDMRPPSGLFHAIFVFAGLLKYWSFVENTSLGELKQYAAGEVQRIRKNLAVARPTLFQTALTEAGRKLACHLYREDGDRHPVEGRE